jgi:hypothetical protein
MGWKAPNSMEHEMTVYDLEYNFRRSPFDQACKRILDENELLNDYESMKQQAQAAYTAQAAQAAFNANPYDPWKQKAGDVIDAEYTVVADVPKIEDGSAEPQEPSA